MIANPEPLINPVNKVKYEVGIKKLKNGKYQTFVLNDPSLKASANSKDEALQKLSHRLQAFFKDTEIVNLEIEIPQPEHPWLKFAGIFENDPQFDEFLQAIQDYRNEIDAEEE
ncbi:type II toxin-antitoxin system HicB family antitoxin [Planktothrix mougeotii]|uniref:Type II toxin-antitoxin system HicB family antitoxin n=1 Tax=Planktothrix mougeotii LEGE 06226 TaxID=1828728 RepID=A0ABR9UIB5_9CYAN|nr:type II toxin-antitoxin system HicB family antitoxin [Planktothrix mougeotii]MBE9145879.1 type II toxin-antitoxin system HicB family antitoxin [Planktothrix mougeotii LEGE 06226]